ncbi:hypothetical protein EN855_033165, partial [Mesorhizobium sp. M1C.F.Ca.ET.212.01.1.1]
MHNSSIARFARTTAVTFKAGVPLVEALGIVAGATGNTVYEHAVLRMRDDVSVGYPVNMAMKQTALFPHMVIPLFVGRDKSMHALEQAMEADKRILLLAQKSAETDDPHAADLYQVGTLAQVLQLLKLPDGTIKVLVEGLSRVQVTHVDERNGSLHGQAVEIDATDEREAREVEAIA